MLIPHSRPHFDERFSQAAQAIILSSHTASGETTRQLEQALMQQCGQLDAAAVDSGTSALMLAIRALQATQTLPIQRIGIPAYACASLWFAVRAAGCQAILMDCGDDLRLNPEQAWQLAPSLDAVVLVHPFGMVEPLVSEAWPCPVIEDIAQAAGALFQEKPVGSFGAIAIASFYATKPWGGAYGGMVMGSRAMCDAVRMMRNPDQAHLDLPYVGHHLLSNLHAALALTRLQYAAWENKARLQHCRWLDLQLPVALQRSIAQRQEGNAFRYIVRMDGCMEGDVTAKIAQLHAVGIGAARPVQQPLHHPLQPPLEGAEKAWQSCISLPVLSHLSLDEYEIYAQGVAACFH